jgi:hypothetical protein
MNEFYNTNNWKVIRFSKTNHIAGTYSKARIAKSIHIKEQGLSIEALFEGVYFTVHCQEELWDKQYDRNFRKFLWETQYGFVYFFKN